MTEYTISITLNDSYLNICGTHVLIVTYVNGIYTEYTISIMLDDSYLSIRDIDFSIINGIYT